MKLWLEAYHAFYKVFKVYKKDIHGIWSNLWLHFFLFYFSSALHVLPSQLWTSRWACFKLCIMHALCIFSRPQQGVISCQPHPKPLSYLYKILLFPLPSNFGIHYQIIFYPVFLLFMPNVPYPFDWALLVYLVLIFSKIELKSTFYSEKSNGLSE